MKDLLVFLKSLKANNSKEWFDNHKKDYEKCKDIAVNLTGDIIKKVSTFDKQIEGLDPKKCLFRINRDVRFSKDKSPYKTNIGASFGPGGKNTGIPGYYIHLEPGASFIGGGAYMPQPEFLNAIRQEIDYRSKDFHKILNDKNFRNYFGGIAEEEKLKTAPKGYDKDHKDIEILKNKHFIVLHYLNDKDLMAPDLISNMVKVFKAMYPFNQFLREAQV